jgi:hypothetical protein
MNTREQYFTAYLTAIISSHQSSLLFTTEGFSTKATSLLIFHATKAPCVFTTEVFLNQNSNACNIFKTEKSYLSKSYYAMFGIRNPRTMSVMQYTFFSLQQSLFSTKT